MIFPRNMTNSQRCKSAESPERNPMPQYKYSRDDYYRLTNAPCLDVAKALGMEINERESDRKSWKIKGEQGLCIYREGNGWYRFSDGRHGFPIDLVKDKLCCSTEQALDFIARYVVNGVSEQVNIPCRTALSEPEKPREFSPPAHDISPRRYGIPHKDKRDRSGNRESNDSAKDDS